MRPTLREEFERALRRYADRIAIEHDGRRLTFADVDHWSTAVARQLRDRGVRPGDAVALHLHNCAEFVVVDVAIARLGAVKVPVNPLLPEATVAHVLSAAGARALVFGAGLADVAVGASRRAGGTELIRVGGGRAPDGVPALVAAPDVPPPPLGAPEPAVGPADRAAVYFTGGTTGLPKGVAHSQASTVALHYAQLLEAEIAQDERLLLMTPLAHAAGLFAQSALVRGATSVIVDGFDADRALDVLARDRITWTFLVPTMIYRLLDAAAARPDLDLALRTVVYGAAPISPTRLAQALATFGRVFVQLYGQTECPNWGTRLAKDDHDPGRPELLASCGRASIMAEAKVVGDAGTTLPPGETGEICLRAPYTLDEYLGDPAATRDKFLGEWIRTGDIGVVDERGYVYLRDRRNDMIVSGGMNVYCREVEDVLARHPSVRRVAVIGVPHDDWGEAVHAVVVPAADAFSAEELQRWSRAELAGYARPKSVEVVDDLPETPFGKVDKKRLREPHWRGRNRGIA